MHSESKSVSISKKTFPFHLETCTANWGICEVLVGLFVCFKVQNYFNTLNYSLSHNILKAEFLFLFYRRFCKLSCFIDIDTTEM